MKTWGWCAVICLVPRGSDARLPPLCASTPTVFRVRPWDQNTLSESDGAAKPGHRGTRRTQPSSHVSAPDPALQRRSSSCQNVPDRRTNRRRPCVDRKWRSAEVYRVTTNIIHNILLCECRQGVSAARLSRDVPGLNAQTDTRATDFTLCVNVTSSQFPPAGFQHSLLSCRLSKSRRSPTHFFMWLSHHQPTALSPGSADNLK